MKIQIEKQMLKSLTLMASMIEARDAYTGGHLWRVSKYCRHLAEAAGLSREWVFLCALGGFLHDIGKISIPDRILGKRGALTEEEYAVVKTHPGVGAVLVQEHPLGGLALPAVLQHHEWVDGTGYPSGLAEDEISIVARVVGIADAFDALTSTRPYRRGVAAFPAALELKKERGTQFDIKLLDIFFDWLEDGRAENIVGHSDDRVAMVQCPLCGPVITVSADACDGDTAYCRVCGSAHRLHRDGDTFVVEPMERECTAEELQLSPEARPIDAFITEAPASVVV